MPFFLLSCLIFYINVYEHNFCFCIDAGMGNIEARTLPLVKLQINALSFWVKVDYLAKWLMDCSPLEKTVSTLNFPKLFRMGKCVAKKGFLLYLFFQIESNWNCLPQYTFPFCFAGYYYGQFYLSEWPHTGRRENWTLPADSISPPSWKLECMTAFFCGYIWGSQEPWIVMYAVVVIIINFSALRIKQISKLILIFCSCSLFFSIFLY